MLSANGNKDRYNCFTISICDTIRSQCSEEHDQRKMIANVLVSNLAFYGYRKKTKNYQLSTTKSIIFRQLCSMRHRKRSYPILVYRIPWKLEVNGNAKKL